MKTLRGIALPILVAVLSVSAGTAAPESTELGILKARIDYGRKPGRDRLSLKAEFDPDLLPAAYDPATDGIAVTIGPVAVISLPPDDLRGRWKVREQRIHKFRRRPTKQERDSLRLRLDTGAGTLRLRADRVDLSALRAIGPASVTIRLTAGSAVYTKTLEMGERDHRWTYRFAGGSNFRSRVPGVGGGLPPRTETVLPFRVLERYPFDRPATFTTQIFRDEASFTAYYLARFGPPAAGGEQSGAYPYWPPYAVDFATEMIVEIDLGWRPNWWYDLDILRVTESASGLRIEWEEKIPENCRWIPSSVSWGPCIIFVVPQHPGPVTFKGSSRTVDCPDR